MSEVKEKLEKLNDEIMKIPGMKELTEATNVPAGAFVFGALVLSVILIAFEFPGTYLLVAVIGLMYPLYKSCMAIQSKEVEDDK